jgi:hypothetical protein
MKVFNGTLFQSSIMYHTLIASKRFLDQTDFHTAVVLPIVGAPLLVMLVISSDTNSDIFLLLIF